MSEETESLEGRKFVGWLLHRRIYTNETPTVLLVSEDRRGGGVRGERSLSWVRDPEGQRSVGVVATLKPNC